MVNPLPLVSINNLAKPYICNTDLDITLTTTINNNGNGKLSDSWSILGETGGINASGVFSPNFKGETSGNYTIEYTYTDTKGCVGKATKVIPVQFTPAPGKKDYFALKDPSATVIIEATNLETNFEKVQWYDASSTAKSTTNPFATGDNANTEVSKKYYVTQFVNGCESKKTEVAVDIIDCPIPAPNVTVTPSATICNYDNTPTIQASVGSPWLAPGGRPSGAVEFRYYTQATGGTPIGTSASGSYTPTIDKSIAKVHQYFVSEYNPNITPKPCESPRTAVTITVNKTLPIQIIGQKDVCERPNEQNPTLQAKDEIGNATVEWYENQPTVPATTTPNSIGKNYTPSFTSVGTHTVYAAQRVNGCMSDLAQASFTIKAIPPAPTTVNNEICEGFPHVTISATGTNIIWYQNADKTGQLATGTQYKPTVTTTKTFFATQTVQGCESTTAPAVYTIKPIPAAPIIKPQPNICAYDAAPVLEATGTQIQWYDEAKLPLTTGSTYQYIHTSAGLKTYYATQTIQGCTSPEAKVTFTVFAKPNKPETTGAEICEGKDPVTLRAQVSQDVWYFDNNASQPTGIKGPLYLPQGTLNKTTSFYVRREQNGCVSDIAEVQLKVIPKPTIVITQPNRAKCVYDETNIIQTNLTPAIGPNDYIKWNITSKETTQKNAQLNQSTFNPDEFLVKNDEITKPWVYTIKGTYYVKAQSGDICESNPAEMTYTVYPRARKPIVAATTICQGTKIEPIQAFGSPLIEWFPQHPSIQDKKGYGQTYNFEMLGITDLDTGLYEFKLRDKTILKNIPDIEDEGCYSNEITATLRVAPAAKTKIIGDSTLCEYTMEEIYTLAYSPEKPSKYRWEVTGNNIAYTKDANSTAVRYVDWSKAGIDTIKVYERTYYECDGYDELIVNIAEYPKAKYTWSLPGASNEVWFRDSTIQNAITEHEVTIPISYTMYWNFDQYMYNDYDKIVEYKDRNTIVEAGGYTYGKKYPELTVINEYGCKSTYKQEIFIDIRSGIYVPTAFSPTNPAYSVRNFHPVGYNIDKCEVWVYDKWGNLVWYSDEVENGIFVGKWDGTYKGELLQSDTYIWKMEAKLLDGKQWEGLQLSNGKFVKYGSVTLIR